MTLFAVVGGDGIHALGWQYVVSPVLIDAVLLLAVALLVNNAIPGRHYPRRLVPDHVHAGGFTEQDLKDALHEYDHPLAASEEEFDAIIALAERKARRRRK